MKKIILVVLAVCMIFAFAACSDQASSGQGEDSTAQNDKSSEEGAKTYHFGLSVPSLEFTFFAAMKTAMEKEFPRDNIEVIVYNGENNQEKQNKDIEDMISKGLDGIVLIPITVEGAVPAIKYANDNNVPVITVDRAVTPDTGAVTVSFVGSDHYPMGLQAGEMLIQALEEKFPDAEQWNVVELEGTPGSSAAIDRGRGINDAIAEDSRVKVIAALNGEFATTTATSIAEDVLTANPDLNAFVCHNDMMAEGCYQALINANRLGEIVVIGIDGQRSTVEKIAEGNIHGTVIQYPDRMAIKGIELLKSYIEGEQVDEINFVATEQIPPSDAQRYIDENLTW